MWRCLSSLLLFTSATSLPQLGKQTKYDELEARMLLNLAAASYGDQHEQCLNQTFPGHEQRVLLKTMRENCDQLDNTCESFVVISEAKKELHITFRGTKTKAQLLLEGWDSIQPGVDFFGMGKVNRYFLNAHLTLWPEIEAILRDEEHKDYTVVFTGHSLGGALASLAAARTVRQGFRSDEQIKLVTFGQPRVGSLEYARNFDQMISYSFRVVFRRDIVPHLPACSKQHTAEFSDDDSKPCNDSAMEKSYHHGTEIWYPDSMEKGSHYVECLGQPRNEDFACSDRIKFHFDQTNSYIWDHRHYFAVKVPLYGKAGCNSSFPEGKPGIFEKVMCYFSPAPHCEEHTLSPTKEIQVVPWEVLNNRPYNNLSSTFSFVHLIFVLLITLLL